MANDRKKFWLIAIIVLFVCYFLIAARPIPRETVLQARWLNSINSGEQFLLDSHASDSFETIPFILGGNFGYVDQDGRFAINQQKQKNLTMSADKWAEYDAEPSLLEIRNSGNDVINTIDNPRGYPVFLDGRTFIINSDQNTLSEMNGSGSVIWKYEFSAPLTCADAAAGLLLAGSVDGIVELLDPSGKQLFTFEPGGSRYSIILGCAFSRDASRFALICGIDRQRFLLFERFGNARGEYKIIYHEFMETGFRRPAHVSFIDGDRRVIFERESGIGIYEINSRKGYMLALDGEIAAIETYGGEGMLFIIVGEPYTLNKKLTGINLPDKIFMNAPFKSSNVFLSRSGSRIFLGGGGNLASFDLEKK